MSVVDFPIKCISKELCEDCPCMEPEMVERYYKDPGTTDLDGLHEIRMIECKNYATCVRMLRYLNFNYDPGDDNKPKQTFDYIGRNGD